MTQANEKPAWQCQRCLWIVVGREGEEIPDHAEQCPFRATGNDPDPTDIEIGRSNDGM